MPRKFASQKIKIEPDFLNRFIAITNSQNATEVANNYPRLAEAEQQEIQEILAKESTQKMLWSGSFLQAEGVVNFGFNDHLKFLVENQELFDFKSPGFFFNTKADQPILALHQGEVVFVGEFKLRGRTVIINHGLGLTSIYSHLGEALVEVGNQVDKGLELGLSGQTGLARKIGYGLEILISGNQINPLNWWDQKWYDGHIEEKILEIKRLYNIPVLEKYSDHKSKSPRR
jgi:murein DD-endopeptidase MepM/ murein hydrolase activator NlpD